MSWWELKRLAIAIAVICLLATAACVGICLALGSFTYQAMGNALFVAAMVLALVGASVGGGVMPSHFPGSASGAVPNAYAESVEHAMIAQHSSANIGYHLQQFKNVSWVLVFGAAAVPMFAASILCLFVLDS